jgi:hypothetical protein
LNMFIYILLMSACSFGGNLVVMNEKKEQTESFYNYFYLSVDTESIEYNKIELVFYDIIASPSLFDIISPTFEYKIEIFPEGNKVDKCILVKLDVSYNVFSSYNLYFNKSPEKIELRKGQFFSFKMEGKDYSKIVYRGKLSLIPRTNGFQLESSGKEKCDLELSKQFNKLDFGKATNAAAIDEKRKIDNAKNK